MPEKPRKAVKAEINKDREEVNLKTASDINVEPRPTRYVKEENRYEKIVDAKKEEKYERNEKKNAKPHIGNKKRVENRWKAEAELESAAEQAEEKADDKKKK